MSSKILKSIISQDEIRNKENKRTKLFLNILRKEAFYGGGLFSLVKLLLFDKYSVEISAKTQIGAGLRLPHLHDIVISKNSTIGSNCTIFHQVTIGVNEMNSVEDAPQIGDNVYIGAGAKIIGDIVIGNDCVVGANAVVTKDIPENTIVTGYNYMRSKV